jgi:eukaryotic-like serine/threonine-protein kinase
MSSSEESDVQPAAPSELGDRQLGGYHLLRRLGRGAMAEVYLAEQVSLRRHVALKILHANLAVQDSYVKRFRLEAQAAASLVHHNIVQIYEVGCSAGMHFIAQEYVQGLNLKELLARRGTLDLELALGIMRQTAAALAKAGERGIVHRDIKPENIMLSSQGEVKVADFGLARLSTVETRLTQEGYTLGTPLYMSPEQVEGRTLDARSDIYSFGVTCYHMLSGQPPYRGDTALNVAVQHLQGQATDLAELRPDLPPALCQLVHKMFAKEADERYASAHEILKQLRTIAAACGSDGDAESHLPVFQGSATAPTSREAITRHLQSLMQSTAAKPARREHWAWLALGLIAAFLIGLAIARLTRPAPLLGNAELGTRNGELKAESGDRNLNGKRESVRSKRNLEIG